VCTFLIIFRSTACEEELVKDNERGGGYSIVASFCKECPLKGDDRLGEEATCIKLTAPAEVSLGTPNVFDAVITSFPCVTTLIPTLECLPDDIDKRGDEGALESKVSSITMSTHHL
jgi:hypothetical protein